MIIFDGKSLADQREEALKHKVQALKEQGRVLKIAAVLFAEDAGSVLYTRLKKEAAERVGIEYSIRTFSLKSGVEEVLAHIAELNADPTVTGIIIQKPWRKTWQIATMVQGEPKDIRQAFSVWWILLTSQIAETKDVDGLHPRTLASIQQGNEWQHQGKVMPATAQAVLTILGEAAREVTGTLDLDSWLKTQKVAIVGKSDILGQPLYYFLRNAGVSVELLGTNELTRKIEQGKALRDFSVVVSATGHQDLVTEELVSQGVVLIDVGEPKPDIDQVSVATKAAFITPVPGGVGPLTVVSLLENAVTVASLPVG